MKFLQEETRSKISELKSAVQREQDTLDSEVAREAAEAGAAAAALRELGARLQALQLQQDSHARLDTELRFWEEQDEA